MSKTSRTGSPGELNGFLDTGCEVQGELRFENTFRVHGRFKGTVESEGQLIIGEGGVVEGVVAVGELHVSGRLEGRVETTRRTEIGAKGRVEGEINAPVLVIESGAFFQGQCTMQSKPSRPPATGEPAMVESAQGESDREPEGHVAH
ncbi:MAG: polymer-forming cytoskeletal protein [Acidobacteriota bacterium]|nr:polymer-forming cytoskeletal protein [Acidobacteriota bacterium]